MLPPGILLSSIEKMLRRPSSSALSVLDVKGALLRQNLTSVSWLPALSVVLEATSLEIVSESFNLDSCPQLVVAGVLDL